MRLHCEPWIGAVLGNDTMLECCSVVNGLHFYTPDVVNNEALTAFENCQQITDRMPLSVVEPRTEPLYLVTPAGEAAVADCDVTALLKTEAGLKRVRLSSKSSSAAGKMRTEQEKWLDFDRPDNGYEAMQRLVDNP